MEAAIPKCEKHITNQLSAISQIFMFISYAVKTWNWKLKTAYRSKYLVIISLRVQSTVGAWLPHVPTALKLQNLALCLECII